ncbi:MAG TPA: oligopeptide/dipeptide ABC transporter ATP-binding protein [Solirubrobacteraceae bacterium]|nr:oligopeptide/dipeptide ABC transporter ATP-binding protein [Solirubrobacteraceae bacterium]
MLAGRVIEQGPVGEVLNRPRHPYTRELVDAVPLLDPTVERRRLADMPAVPRSRVRVVAGCPYRLRCPRAIERCAHDDPRFAAPARAAPPACLSRHPRRCTDDRCNADRRLGGAHDELGPPARGLPTNAR